MAEWEAASSSSGAASKDEMELILQRMRRDFAVLAASLASSQPASSHLSSPAASFEAPKPRTRCCRCLSRLPRGQKLPRWLISNILLISFLWQCLVVILYRVVFNKAFSSDGVPFDVGVGVMVSMQVGIRGFANGGASDKLFCR